MSVRAKLIASFGALMTIILDLGGIINYLHVQDDADADPVWIVVGFAVAITGIVSGISSSTWPTATSPTTSARSPAWPAGWRSATSPASPHRNPR
ncbi:MAG: hypothetical protein QGG58_01385 [Chloroflexota bacterium]|nr:hypothetical protein [Chloroflexota bacterium]